MGHHSSGDLEQALVFARSTASSMLAAAQQNSGVKRVEVPLPTFINIAHALSRLTDELDQPQAGAPARGAAYIGDAVAGQTREEWIASLSIVPTMGGNRLSDVLAPAEIGEIVDAVVAAIPRHAPAPAPAPASASSETISDDLLRHLFAINEKHA